MGSKELYNVYILESEFDEIYNSYYKKVMAIRLLIEKSVLVICVSNVRFAAT